MNRRYWLVLTLAMGLFLGAFLVAIIPVNASLTAGSWSATLTCTADAAGYCTANHPAGVVPDAVLVTPTAPAMVSVDQVTGTTFRVRFTKTNGSGTIVALTGTRSFCVYVDWTPTPSGSSPGSPSASASPTPSPSSPPLAFPDASTTGVPAGQTLAVVNGDVTLATAGMTYSNREVNGCIEVTAPGVTIQYVKVHCGGFEAIRYGDNGVQTTRLTIADSEVDCLDTIGRTAIGDTNITALRLNIHGCENGFDLDQWDTVSDSYVHDLATGGTAHSDDIQLSHYLNGCSTSVCEVSHAREILVQHNTLYAGTNTDASMISNPVGDLNVTIDRNLMAGGGWTLYCDYQGSGTNFQVTNNQWSRLFYPLAGEFGPAQGCSDESATNNTWADNGTPIPLG